MDIGKLSYYCRRIHRLSLLFVVVLGLIQMITGLAMKYPEWYPFFDQAGTRLLHFQAASWFAFVFGVQLVTGLIMYLVPVIIKYQQKKRMASQTSGQE